MHRILSLNFHSNRFLFLIISLILGTLSGCGGIPADAQKSYEEGIMAQKQKDMEKAARALEKAIELAPKYKEAYIKLGEIYIEIKDYPKAEKAFEKAQELLDNEGSNSAVALLGLGKVCTLMKEYQKGFYHYSKALKLVPRDYSANFGAGYCRFEQELYDEALPLFKVSYDIDKNSAEALFYVALTSQKSRRSANLDILKQYEEAAKKKYTLAHKYIGDIYRSNGYKILAMNHYNQFLKSGGKDQAVEEWLNIQKEDEEKKLLAAKKAQQEANPQEKLSPPVEKQPQYEIIKICPKCGRLHNKEATQCEFDGEKLTEERREIPR